MKLTTILLLFISSFIHGQSALKNFEPTDEDPYGKPAPNSPESFLDFDPLIGICKCESLQRNPDGGWQDTLGMEWKFKYIMNGTAVQDEVWREGGVYARSIRQYHQDSAKWVVTYFSYPSVSVSPGTWLGQKNEEGDIVLTKPQKAPNGMEGASRLTFYEITESGFNWTGEWVSIDESIVYPFWKIWCKKMTEDN